MALPVIFERGECQAECLNCYERFYDEHWYPACRWLYCPVCGIKWQCTKLQVHNKWHRFYESKGIDPRLAHDAKVTVWVTQKRWHGWDGKIDEWETDRHFGYSGRENALQDFRRDVEDEYEGGIHHNLFWEFRLIRKEITVCWSKYWDKEINGK